MGGDAVRLLASLSVPIFVVASMLGMGLSLHISQILLAGANHRTVLGVFIANFVVVPALALALRLLIPVSPSIATGLLVLAVASGAPILPKLVQMARGDLALATSITIILMAATILFLPVILPLLVGSGVDASRWDLARPLIFYMLIPLGSGLLIRRWRPNLAAELWPITNRLAQVTLVVAIARLIVVNAEGLRSALRTGALVTALAFLAGSFLAGYLLGGRNPDERLVGGLATAQRDISAALLLATINFANQPGVSLMVVLVGLLGLFGLMAVAIAFRSLPKTARGVAAPATNSVHWRA